MPDAPTPQEIEALLARVPEGFTAGPWRWEVNRKGQIVELCGGEPAGRFDKTVMNFVRWGMNRAAPMFWFWRDSRHWSEPPKRADDLSVAVPGREHHADWFAAIDPPDAALIALAPDLALALRALAEENARKDANAVEASRMLADLSAKLDAAAEVRDAKLASIEAGVTALAEERERHLGLLWFAWSEFNAIRARHGAPITSDGMYTCAPDWWDAMTEAFAEAIGEDAQKPWPGERTKAIAVELAAKMEAAPHE